MVLESDKISLFTCSCPVLSTSLIEERLSFLYFIFLQICHRLVDYRCISLSLDFLFCFINLHSVFVPVTYCFEYGSFVYNWKSGSLTLPVLFFFFKIAFAIQNLLCYHTNCRIFCSNSVKNAIGNFIGLY